MFTHAYKRHNKDGWLSEIVQVDDKEGRVVVYHIEPTAYSFEGLNGTSEKFLQRELKPRHDYWRDTCSPMDKVEQARKIEEKRKKAQAEYEERKSKTTSDERKALAEYETDRLMSGVKSLMKN